MKKDKFTAKFREYARKLSPQQGERDLIVKIYQSFNDIFGVNNCIQIGSYPRHTAITPVKDLDILYFLGDWDENGHNPLEALQMLYSKLTSSYKNPTSYSTKVSLQTHSVTICYLQGNDEIISIDIVPAYHFSKNEFNDDTYKVPEVVAINHGQKRSEYYQSLVQQHKDMSWIISDPKGYIRVASELDKSTNGEFRKSVKIIKKWRFNLEEADKELKLKSFHLEQVVTKYFQQNPNVEIFDAVFKFFYELPKMIDSPDIIKDRANDEKFIDDYLKNFTDEQKTKIKSARDGFLVKLENCKESTSIDTLLAINFYCRSASEQFLFDDNVKTFIENELSFKIDGFVEPMTSYSSGWLSQTPQLQKGLTRGLDKVRKIKFSIRSNNTNATDFRWKVKNDNNCAQPRGEITPNQTKNNPESTEYAGDHYVECYAINNTNCIAKHRIQVKII